MNSSSAGLPARVCSIPRWIAALMSPGSVTLSPYPPNARAIAAEEVASANHDAHLNAERVNLGQLPGDIGNSFRIETKTASASKGFA